MSPALQFRRDLHRLASRVPIDDDRDVRDLLGEVLVVALARKRGLIESDLPAEPADHRRTVDDLIESLPDAISFPTTADQPPVLPEVVADLYNRFDALVTDDKTDYLGEFHQATLDGESRSSSGESRRASGTFYTPRRLTRYVVDQTLGRRLYGTQNGRPDGESIAGRDPMARERAAELRILDPAAGVGAFLRQAYRTLVAFYERCGVPEVCADSAADVALGQLYGVDRDERATGFARLNLAFDAAARGGDLETGGSVLDENIATADALLFEQWPGAEADDGRAIDFAAGTPCRWGHEFPEVFDDGGFDIVVGNPPWISYGLRDAGTLGDGEKAYLREQFDAAQYKLPLYPLFMELSLRLCREDGATSLVVPDSFLVGSQFSNVRELLVDRHALEMVTLLSDGLWADGTSGRTVVYRATPSVGRSESVSLRTVDGETGDIAESELSVSQERLRGSPGHRIEVFADDASDRLVETMRRADARVADIVDLYSGCIARFGQASIVAPSPLSEHTIRDRSDEIILADDEAEPRWQPLVSSGRKMQKYGPATPDKYIYIHPDPEIRRRYFKSGHDLERYRAPKLLMRQTGDAPVVAWDGSGCFCLNNLHVVDPHSETDAATLRALLGLLNSRPMRLFYQAVTMERGRALAQTDIETIERLPIPAPDNAAEWLGDPVKRVIDRRHDLASADDSLDHTNPEVDEIDDRVRELYGLEEDTVERVAENLRE